LVVDLKEHSHRRFNPLTREWILVSPHRTERPWLGQVEKSVADAPPTYDPTCYMCPGNVRAAGIRNPDYQVTFVFDNDYPALLPGTPQQKIDQDGLLIARSESGVCRVLCFSPRHDLTMSSMPFSELRCVVDVWAQQFEITARRWGRATLIRTARSGRLPAFRMSPARNKSRSRITWLPTGPAWFALTWSWSEGRAIESSSRTAISRRWFRSGRFGRSKRWWFRGVI
jgi:hypothetical protein